MAAHCKGSVIFFARDGGHPVIAAHRAAGGRAAFVRDGQVILAEGGQEVGLKALAQVPLTGGGRIGFQVENVLASVAAAWGLGVQQRTIRAALRSFGTGVEQSPARFNLLEVNGAVAVLDYGHNPSSLAAILETLAQFPAASRLAVYSAAGDRRDGDLIRQGEMLGDAFDRVILYEDENCTRGREPGEIIRLIRQGVEGRRRACEVLEVMGAVRAVDRALSMARSGELLLIQVDVVDATLELVQRYLSDAAAREVSMEEALVTFARDRAEATLELAEAGPADQGRRDWAGLPLGRDA
jgi:cyanophycin synthetase